MALDRAHEAAAARQADPDMSELPVGARRPSRTDLDIDELEAIEAIATLPAGLDMSEADQERPRARQAAEMQRSDSRRLRRELRRMVQDDGWSPRTVHDFLYLLGLTATCNIAWSVLMYLRIVKRSDLSWLHVMAPLIASSVLCAAFVLHQVWQRRAVAAHRWRTQYGPVRPATLFVENLGNIGTLWLLAGHLERSLASAASHRRSPEA